MEYPEIIYSDFGCVPCGHKAIRTVKIKNKSKKIQVLAVSNPFKNTALPFSRLHIHPKEFLAKPGQTVHFVLTYLSNVGDVTENYHYNVLNTKEIVAKLHVHARSVGPSITPTVFNLKFFCFRDQEETVKHVHVANNSKCEAKFFFDLDEDFEQLEISQRTGVIPANNKITLKFTFKPVDSVVYYRKIFCLVQFHDPLIFNVLAIYKPKAKVDVKSLVFNYPPETHSSNNSETYIERVKGERTMDEEKLLFSQKFLQEFETNLQTLSPGPILKLIVEWEILKNASFGLEPKNSGETNTQENSSQRIFFSPSETESRLPSEGVFLTCSYLNIKNSYEVSRATALVNLSESQIYYYEWEEDPKHHFQVCPCRGLLKPNTKANFTINFMPSALDFIYHAELDIKVFICQNDPEDDSPEIVDLPLSLSLRIIGNSFPDDSCGWMPQCKAMPKVVHFRPCVPGENVYATFMIERQGHLPVNFAVLPLKEQDFIVQPTLGYLSKSFQLLLVRFSSESKKPGLYKEDLKIIFNDSDCCIETIKLFACVEIPILKLGSDNSMTFPAVAPKSTISKILTIENPTHLYLRYDFEVPADITWMEIKNSKGSIEPKAAGKVEVTFKPEEPSEFLDYIPCFVSSTSEVECTQKIYLTVKASCQFGCLVATPSIYDFGECVVGETKTVNIHLFNFSALELKFKLTPALGSIPNGDPERDVSITPTEEVLLGKMSLEVQVKIRAHSIGPFHYVIEYQIFNDKNDPACENPRRIFSMQFEGVSHIIQVSKVFVSKGGPLFSPYWLWKMLDTENVNKALKSMSKNRTIKVCVPESMQDSQPIILNMLFETGGLGEIVWDYRVEVNCPCLEGSLRNFTEGLECVHTKAVFFPCEPFKLTPYSRLLAQVTLKFEEPTECEVTVVVSSINGSLSIRIPVTVLPADKPSHAAFFTPAPFNMKPIFIGDPLPPLQLFWMYNNSEHPASYSLNREALWKSTNPEFKVFDCVNACGIVPPFSISPLAFVFRPKEPKNYRAKVKICFKDRSSCITLKGRGVLNYNRFQELALECMGCERDVVESQCLECSEIYINIPYIRQFSHARRLFFLRNTSKKEKWSFRWHSFCTDNIITIKVVPQSGTLAPEQALLMTLLVETFCHTTTVNASIPCDILNYSQLQQYFVSTNIQKIMEENTKECFTITERGITREVPTISEAPRPQVTHIFLNVNVNIVNNLNIDLKLTPEQQSKMGAECEVEMPKNLKCPLKSPMLKTSQEFLEKLLWNTLCSSSVAGKVSELRNPQDYYYLQLKTETKKMRAESLERLRTVPKINTIQRFLEGTLQDVLRNSFLGQPSDLESSKE